MRLRCRSGGWRDEDKVAFRGVGEAAEECVALVAGASAAGVGGAGVGFVDDDKVGGGAEELVSAPVAFDEVGGHDRVGEHVEDALAEPA